MLMRQCIYPMLVAENPAKWGSSDTLFITFTKEQSETMATAVPQRLGPGYSIIHLGQAAFLLAQIKLKPDDIPVSSRESTFTPACIGSQPLRATRQSTPRLTHQRDGS